MDKKDWFINEETKEMAEKVKKISKEMTPGWGRKRLSTETLEELGNWLYKHRDDYDETASKIDMMLYNNLDLYEQRVVLEAFDKNVDTDFSGIVSYLIKKLNTKLKRNIPFCVDIVFDYFQLEFKRSWSKNFNRYLLSVLAEEVISIADEISCGEKKASNNIVMQCEDLIDFATKEHLSTYIAYLIEKNGLLSKTLAIIHGIYFKGKPFLLPKLLKILNYRRK